MVNVILVLILFLLLGWIVHFIMGKGGWPLHYCFIGGAGAGVGTFL